MATPSSSKPPAAIRHAVGAADFGEGDVRQILDDARRLEQGVDSPDHSLTRGRPLVALLFLTPSLRTRVGFAAASMRLGGGWLEADGRRHTAGMSKPESFGDLLRVLSGMVDAVVVRTPDSLTATFVAANAVTPVINGGDGKPGEHPSQALIDLYTIERECGPVGNLRLGIVGDLSMRSVRSLLGLLSKHPPRELRLMAPPSRQVDDVALGPALAAVTTLSGRADLTGLDVVNVVGLPAGVGPNALSAGERARFALDAALLQSLGEDSVVISPMPVIDEVVPEVRSDPRVVFHRQSDRAVYVRMALVRWLLRYRT